MLEQKVSLASNGVVKVPGYEQLVRFGYTKNRGVYRLAVTATGEWEGLTIRAFWHTPGGKDPAASLVVDGYVDVPASVTAQSGNGCITFEGSDGTKTVTSADLRYRVSANSGTEDGTMPEPGTPAWQQLVEVVHTNATAAEQARKGAETAAARSESAADRAESAQQETENAKTDALTAIGTNKQEALDAVQEAQTTAVNAVDDKEKEALANISTGIDPTLSVEGKAADAAKVGEAVNAEAERAKGMESQLKEDLVEVYSKKSAIDMYNGNVQIVKTNSDFISAVWDIGSKTINQSMSDYFSSNRTCLTILSPKFIAGHSYVIAIKYLYSAAATTTIKNVFSTSNFNYADAIIKPTIKNVDEKEVLKFTATQDGWLCIGKLVGANKKDSWGYKLAIYDVTDLEEKPITDSQRWLTFADDVVFCSGKIINLESDVKNLESDVKNLESDVKSNYDGQVWSAIGDSITASGSGGKYLEYTKAKLGLSIYKNCGIGGTRVSGVAENAMYQDDRINTLDLESNVVTILGGTNDIYQNYYENHPDENNKGWGEMTNENIDVKTFVGAYNVMLSKIYYKFRLSDGYYPDIDYNGITRVLESSIKTNFRIFILVPPRRFDTGSINKIKAGAVVAEKVKDIAKMWGIPYVDLYNDMGINDMNKDMFWKYQSKPDYVHISPYAHSIVASLLCSKANENNNV